MAINGKAAAVIGIGALFTWSGIKGWSITGTLQDLVAGKKPVQTDVNPLSVPGVAASPSGTAGGLAGAAEANIGHAYVFGGAPGPQGGDPWDCSSMVNYLAGVLFNKPIPGYKSGAYDGKSHGPTTGQWAIWNGFTTVKRADVQAGDIVVWATHMGIAVSNSEMVSALNEKEGTRQTPIDSPAPAPGPILRFGRYT